MAAEEEMKPRSALLREALEKKKDGHADTAMLSRAETCRRLGVSRWTLDRLIREKEIRSVKIGKRRLFSPKAIEQYIAQREADEADA